MAREEKIIIVIIQKGITIGLERYNLLEARIVFKGGIWT